MVCSFSILKVCSLYNFTSIIIKENEIPVMSKLFGPATLKELPKDPMFDIWMLILMMMMMMMLVLVYIRLTDKM